MESYTHEEAQFLAIGRLHMRLEAAEAQCDYYRSALSAISQEAAWAGDEPSTFLRGAELAAHALSKTIVRKLT